MWSSKRWSFDFPLTWGIQWVKRQGQQVVPQSQVGVKPSDKPTYHKPSRWAIEIDPKISPRTGSRTTTDAWVESSVLHCYTLECPTEDMAKHLFEFTDPPISMIERYWGNLLKTLQRPNWISVPNSVDPLGFNKDRHELPAPNMRQIDWTTGFRLTGEPYPNPFGSWFVSNMGIKTIWWSSYSLTFRIAIKGNYDLDYFGGGLHF